VENLVGDVAKGGSRLGIFRGIGIFDGEVVRSAQGVKVDISAMLKLVDEGG
jgi:hypothetical protein